MKTINVWTDGSCIVQKKVGGWAVVSDNGYQSSGTVIGTTNNEMELFAIYKALKEFSNDSIIIHSDSEYSIKTLTKWAGDWKKKGWRRKGGPIKNLQLIQTIFDIIENNDNIVLKHVKAHNGNAMNELADRLAREAARKGVEVII